MQTESAAISPSGLRRTLRFRDLVLYGIILVQPTAPMPSFGIIYTEARGHVVTAILFALVAMLFTAISYGRMARAYPVGGSAFLYVGRELHPGLGYLTGWCMAMDYILNPLICTIWCSRAAINFMPGVPYAACAVFFAVLFTLLNLNGVQTSARLNAGLAAVLGLVIVMFVAAALRHLVHAPPVGLAAYTRPFYDPATFSSHAVFRGTSIAVLTYIGFDGISTLTDEARDPARSVPRAIVLTCLITGVLASIEVYVGQLLWPQAKAFPDVDTAFTEIARIAGGAALFIVVNASLLVANIGSGVASQLGAARLLLTMGQDQAIPGRFFGAVESRRHIPRNNILFIGVICLGGALLMSYEVGTELLNYGALLAFMGVNLSSAVLGWRAGGLREWWPILLSVLGLLICFALWIHLGSLALTVGSLWALLGIAVYLMRRSQGQVHL